MSWSITEEYMISFLDAFFLFLSIILIPEIRKRKRYWITNTGLIIIFILLGWDITRRTNNEKRDAKNIQSTMNHTIQTLSQGRKIDSTKFAEFIQNLQKEHNLTRDTNTNRPIIYNTNIKNARDVNIGSR